jgi:transmembrane sensor
MDIQHTKELLQKYQSGNCSDSENELIESWYKQLVDTGEWQWSKDEKEMMEKMIEARINKQINGTLPQKVFYLKPRFQWWAAASVIFLLAGFSYFTLSNKKTIQGQVAKVSHNDVKAPQSNIATITLSNGQKVNLDSVGNGALAVQGNVKLIKLANGKIAYQQSSGEVITKIEYNTLSNPRGSKVINMSLADGSKVWLNAGSSLTYPVSFIGNERKVSVTGEAYFEVAHDASRPFIVNNGTMDVRVLGTHFNVNSFKDDGNDIKVTLLEGSVKIENGNATGILKPGQQGVVTSDVKVLDNVNLDQVMAWKNGYFQFDNASLQNVLKEISRWYDVDVVYEGKNQPRVFMGEMQRDLNLTEVLKILQMNKVHFKIAAKELRIMPD